MNMNLNPEVVLPEGVLPCDLPRTPRGIELDEQASAARIVIATARAIGRRRDGDGPDQGHFPEGTTYRMVRDNPLVAAVSDLVAITDGLTDSLNAIPTILDMRRRGNIFGRFGGTGKILKIVDSGSRAEANDKLDPVYLGHIHAKGETSRDVGCYPKGTVYDPFDPDRSVWTSAVQGRADEVVFEWLVHPLSNDQRQELWQGRILNGALVGSPPDRAPKTHQERDEYIKGRHESGELFLLPAAKYLGLRACFDIPVPGWMHFAIEWLNSAMPGFLLEETREAFGIPYGPEEKKEFHKAVPKLSRVNTFARLFMENMDTWLFEVAAKTEKRAGPPYIPDPYAEQV